MPQLREISYTLFDMSKKVESAPADKKPQAKTAYLLTFARSAGVTREQFRDSVLACWPTVTDYVVVQENHADEGDDDWKAHEPACGQTILAKHIIRATNI